jgi:hypothetical protein
MLLGGCKAAKAGYSFTTIDIPNGWSYSSPWGINHSGQIVGDPRFKGGQ